MQGFIRILVISCLSMATISQAKHMDDDTIDSRTSPIGHVHIEGMETAEVATETTEAETVTPEAEAPAAETTVATAGRSGETLYNSFCVACHSIGLANAPKFADSAAWGKLLERGMDDLVSSAKKGKNVMPPMGTCADCSDDELKSAIQFMSGISE